MQQRYPTIKDLGAEILAVNTGQVSDAQKAVDELSLTFPVLHDEGRVVAKQYGVFDLLDTGEVAPAIFLIDVDGMIRWRYLGHQDEDWPANAEVESQLRALAKVGPVIPAANSP